MNLNDLPIGKIGCISSIQNTDCYIYERLLTLGFLPGTPISIKRRGFAGGVLEISLRGFRISMRNNEAACIWLKN